MAVAMLGGCNDPDAGEDIQTREQTANLHSVQVALTAIPRIYQSPGSVVSSQEFVVTSNISGFIQVIAVEEGDWVEAGDCLVQIDPTKVERAIAQAEASVAAARAELEDAEDDVRKYRALVKSESISKERLRKAVLRQKQARAALNNAQAALDVQRTDLDYIQITSPASAQVSKRLLNVGDLSLPGAPILQLESLESMEFETHVPEKILIHIQLGQPVTVELDVLDQTITGELMAAVQSADPATRSGKVKVRLPDRADLIPGMFGRVSFITGNDTYLTVPETSVVTRAGVEGVFVVSREYGARFVSVRTGARWKDQRIILAGLRPDDRVLPDPPAARFD
ncbi:MAG: efflux RND transporter periplasmic adaptor subunit [Chromatiales bacterium]|nr:efflux RND transporter periplasmic adaptor subunit [Chromatiales bacterium]